MKFETIEEVAAPQDYTFARFTDFTRYEGLARKYGADIRRVGGFTEVAEGATWRGTMQVRGKTRGVEAVVTRYAPPEAARIEAETGVPVLDSVAVTAAHCLREMGLDPARVTGWGSVFQRFSDIS